MIHSSIRETVLAWDDLFFFLGRKQKKKKRFRVQRLFSVFSESKIIVFVQPVFMVLFVIDNTSMSIIHFINWLGST